MDSKDILLIIALIAIVSVVGVMQFTNVIGQTSFENAVSQMALASQAASNSNTSSQCLKGLQNAAEKLECVQGDFDVLGWALYLKASGDPKAARDYCKNAPTTGCQGLCTAALNCVDL